MKAEAVKNMVLGIFFEIVNWLFLTAIVVGIAAPLLTTMAIYQEMFDFTWFWRIADYFFPGQSGNYGINEIMWFYSVLTLVVGLVSRLTGYLVKGWKISWRQKFIALVGVILAVYLLLALASLVRLDVEPVMYLIYFGLMTATLVPAVILMSFIWLIEKMREKLIGQDS